MGHLIVMFAKAPVPGRVKTRLHAAYSPEDAAALHAAFLVDQAGRLLAPRTGWTGWISVAGDRDHAILKEIAAMGIERVPQPGESLGDKMACAIEMGLEAGFDSVTLIGSDSPTLPRAYLEGAVSMLDRHPVVLGPSTDGGFVSISADRAAPGLRREILWSASTTLVETIDALECDRILAGLTTFWYDVDEPGDVEFLRRHLRTMGDRAEVVAPCTCAWLRAHPSP